MSVNSEFIQQAMKPGWFIDSDNVSVQQFAEQHRGEIGDARTMAIALYNAVRDQIYYDPYSIRPDPSSFRASAVLGAGKGHCVGKAVLYAAVLRASDIPARIGFADVRNHLTTPQLRQLMGTDMFYHHGYSEVWLDGRWLKATPAFNLSLCEKFGICPLEFDGTEDSIFHPFDSSGRQHMEYVKDHGPHLDLPYDDMMAVYRRHYPAMFAENTPALAGNFEAEAFVAKSLG
jgi:transglutaminase-like putative cysteine protease